MHFYSFMQYSNAFMQFAIGCLVDLAGRDFCIFRMLLVVALMHLPGIKVFTGIWIILQLVLNKQDELNTYITNLKFCGRNGTYLLKT